MQNIYVESHPIIPSKILCVGRNYLAHINELNNEIAKNMVLFFKPNSAISNTLLSSHGLSEQTEALHYEAEICFLYECHRFSAVGIGLDLTKRALQSQLKQKGLPWERAKAFDGSALFSDFVKIDNVSDELQLNLYIDDVLTQVAKIPNMIYSPEDILQTLQSFITLEDGDVIMTGTPAGVGPVEPGNHFKGDLYSAEKLLLTKVWIAE